MIFPLFDREWWGTPKPYDHHPMSSYLPGNIIKIRHEYNGPLKSRIERFWDVEGNTLPMAICNAVKRYVEEGQ